MFLVLMVDVTLNPAQLSATMHLDASEIIF